MKGHQGENWADKRRPPRKVAKPEVHVASDHLALKVKFQRVHIYRKEGLCYHDDLANVKANSSQLTPFEREEEKQGPKQK